ncbi:MAG: hypothetical protein D6826_09895, partial [Alphaproteobacteria bacterium]
MHWRHWHDLPPPELPAFFANTLPAAIDNLRAHHEPLAAALRRLRSVVSSLGRLEPGALATLTDWLVEQPFETPNDRRRLLAEFDTFLDHASSRQTGPFRTPACIDELLVALAAPAPGERLYDPCFGFAGILTAACQRVQQADRKGFARQAAPALEIAGVEIHPEAFAVGLARLVLAGVTRPQLELGNSLERESAANPQKEGFDVVACNPPWGARLEPRGLDHFPVRTTDSSALFVQHALAQLRPDGRAVIVVPQGLLFQSGRMAALRKWLLEHHRVDAVISVPEGAFLPVTGIRAALLVLRRNGGLTRRIRMVDGAAWFEPRKGREPARIQPEQIEALAAAVREARPSEAAWDVNAESLADFDHDLTPVRRDRTALQEILASLERELPVAPLKDVCRIMAGVQVKADLLVDRPVGDEPVAYVRIGDIQHGEASKATSWLTPEAASELGPRHRLRTGQVLVCRSGTIGKAGVVRNGAVGGVAANGLFVLEPDVSRLDPHFLAAYINSRECRAWLEAKAGGAVIKSLKKQFVEALPAPLPPLLVQHRVAADVREHGVDALTQLLLLLTRDEDDPLAQWMDRGQLLLEEAGGGKDVDASQVVRLRVFGAAFDPVRAWVSPENEDRPLLPWARRLIGVADLFRGSEEVPRGPALLSLLQQGLRELSAAAAAIAGHTPMEARAREFTGECAARLEQATRSLLEDVRVVVQPRTESLPAGERTTVAFRVHNEGPLPLRNFHFNSQEGFFPARPVFLPERSQQTLTAEVQAPPRTGRHSLVIEWTAMSLDGTTHAGQQEVAFAVQTAAAAEPEVELGLSPYFVSQPVGPERSDVFFGREKVLEQIKRQIQSGNTVLLEGNRRAGKSSILRHLEGPDPIPGWLAVYSSFQGATGDNRTAGMPTETVWRLLAQ